MAKEFNPLEYNYELVSNNNDVCNFQRIIKKEKLAIQDIVEICYWSIPKIWVFYVESINLNQFLKEDFQVTESIKIPLFVGQIKGDFDYQLLTKRMCTDPNILIQLGS